MCAQVLHYILMLKSLEQLDLLSQSSNFSLLSALVRANLANGHLFDGNLSSIGFNALIHGSKRSMANHLSQLPVGDGLRLLRFIVFYVLLIFD